MRDFLMELYLLYGEREFWWDGHNFAMVKLLKGNGYLEWCCLSINTYMHLTPKALALIKNDS